MLSNLGKQQGALLLRRASLNPSTLRSVVVPAVTRAAAVLPYQPSRRHYGATKRSEMASSSSSQVPKLLDFHRHPLFSMESVRPRGFDDFFGPSPFFRDPFFADPMPVLRRPSFLTGGDDNDDVFGSTLKLFRSSPGYEINETDDGKYQIAVDVPGVKIEDLKVQVEGDDNALLRITGGRKVRDKETGGETLTRFEKCFSIGDNVNMEELEAKLEDGVLVLTAPKIEKKEETPQVRTIEIAQGKGTTPGIADELDHEITPAEVAEAEEASLKEDEKAA